MFRDFSSRVVNRIELKLLDFLNHKKMFDEKRYVMWNFLRDISAVLIKLELLLVDTSQAPETSDQLEARIPYWSSAVEP